MADKRRTVWITGASSGLGRYTAQALGEAGFCVIAGARSFTGDKAADGIFRLAPGRDQGRERGSISEGGAGHQ